MSLQTGKPTCGVLIFEKQPYWGPELKRQFADQRAFVRECRSVDDLLPAVLAFSTAVAVLVLDAAPAECLGWVRSQVANAFSCPFIVIASTEWKGLEWSLREAGADEFLHDEIVGRHLARICRHLLRRSLTVAPRVAAPFGQ